MKKMMRSTFGRLFNKNWVMAATLCITDGSTYTITAHLKKVE